MMLRTKQLFAFVGEFHEPHFGGYQPAGRLTMDPLEDGRPAAQGFADHLARNIFRTAAVHLEFRADIHGREF